MYTKLNFDNKKKFVCKNLKKKFDFINEFDDFLFKYYRKCKK